MDFYILWILSSIGAFTIVMTVLVVAYIFYALWRESKEEASEPATYTTGAAYDACEEPPYHPMNPMCKCSIEPTTDYDTEAVRKLLNSW